MVKHGVRGPGQIRASQDRAKRFIRDQRVLPRVAADLPERIGRGRKGRWRRSEAAGCQSCKSSGEKKLHQNHTRKKMYYDESGNFEVISTYLKQLITLGKVLTFRMVCHHLVAWWLLDSNLILKK